MSLSSSKLSYSTTPTVFCTFLSLFIYLQMFIQDSHFSENTVFQMRPVDYNVNM